MLHKGFRREDAIREATGLLFKVGIPNPEQRIKEYPHQFSGGMQQRVMIAMAMSCQPDVLVADEPTTALDVTVQAQVLEQLNRLRTDFGTALLIITHNLGVVARYADSVKIMYGGKIVEQGSTEDIFHRPHHPYTIGLIKAAPRLDLPRSQGLQTIQGEPPDMADISPDCCTFHSRCPYATDECRAKHPVLKDVGASHSCACFHMVGPADRQKPLCDAPRAGAAYGASGAPARADSAQSLHLISDVRKPAPARVRVKDTILSVEDLKMYFPVTKGLLKRRIGDVKAVDGISFSVVKGETFGIVGESGCGKSTVGNCVMRNCAITDGRIVFKGKEIGDLPPKALRRLRGELQMITQDPFSSLDPRMTVRGTILEGIRIQHIPGTAKEHNESIDRVLTLVGLNPKLAERYPHEFSGGQRQRISIARALALSPDFIVCDEIVSALDVSIQAQVVNLMIDIQQKLGLTYIFIGHDLSVVRYISNNIAVIYLGKIVELTDSDELYAHPFHPYTQALISAAPIPDPVVDRMRERIVLQGEIPSPINPPRGCNFSTRCPYTDRRCIEEEPDIIDVGNNHLVACHKVVA
jgi:peptide/nickel transport system ATP-binding protein